MDSFQINSSTCETPPFPIVYLSCICHCGCVYLSSFGEIIWSKSTINHLSLVFHLYLALANCLNFVSMAYTIYFQRIQCLLKDRYILLIFIIIYYCHHDSEWNNLSWVLLYILEQFLPWMHAGPAQFSISLSVWVF